VIDVPRPDLGELVPEFSDEATLYGRELVLDVCLLYTSDAADE